MQCCATQTAYWPCQIQLATQPLLTVNGTGQDSFQFGLVPEKAEKQDNPKVTNTSSKHTAGIEGASDQNGESHRVISKLVEKSNRVKILRFFKRLGHPI